MAIKTFRAKTTTDALRDIKVEFGDKAIILHTRTVKKPGVLGVVARETVEITATNGTKEQVAKLVAHARQQQQAKAASEVEPKTHITPAQTLSGANETQAPSTLGTGLYGPKQPRARGIKHSAEPELTPEPLPTECRTKVLSRNTSADTDIASMQSELSSIRSALANLVAAQRIDTARGLGRSSVESGLDDLADPVARQYLRMIQADVADDIAREVIARISATLDDAAKKDESAVRSAVRAELAALVPTSQAIDCTKNSNTTGCPCVITFVGPTGVGKTTTLAKLAATYALCEKKRVGLITIDTYRIAAVDQLRTYAEIIGVPLIVAQTEDDVRAARDSLSSCDVILLDTAGRAPQDTEKIDELRAMVACAQPDEVHLVLSATASQASLSHAAACFAPLQPDRIVFTKLDEAVNFGVLINTARKVNLQLSYLSDGQDVPDRLHAGGADTLAELVMSGRVA